MAIKVCDICVEFATSRETGADSAHAHVDFSLSLSLLVVCIMVFFESSHRSRGAVFEKYIMRRYSGRRTSWLYIYRYAIR